VTREERLVVPEADIEVAAHHRCTKVNIDTDLRLAMTAAIREVSRRSRRNSIPANISAARKAVKELVRHKVRNVLCCAGHAFD